MMADGVSSKEKQLFVAYQRLIFENLKLLDELEGLWSTKLIVWMIHFTDGFTK